MACAKKRLLHGWKVALLQGKNASAQGVFPKHRLSEILRCKRLEQGARRCAERLSYLKARHPPLVQINGDYERRTRKAVLRSWAGQ